MAKKPNDQDAERFPDVKTKDAPAAFRRGSTEPNSAPLPKPDGLRDGIEAVVIAFILAFLFRTFEAEAFVIPTGSMAPGLMGAHHDLTCEICGYRYQVNSHELDEKFALEHAREVAELYDGFTQASARGDKRAAQAYQDRIDRENQAYANRMTVRGTCPICRFTMDLQDKSKGDSRGTAFSGDRLIVTKFPYEFGQPRRFDVAVFKYPHGPRENYIKRIVGLPNENILLFHGDVFTSPVNSDQPLTIARKPESKLLAMSQIVHDNNYVVRPNGEPDPLLAAGWPTRWHGGSWNNASGVLAFDRARTAWTAGDEGRAFSVDQKNQTPDDWLRYQHIVPGTDVWDGFVANKMKSLPTDPQAKPRPELITDFYAYDTNLDMNDIRGFGRNADAQQVIGLGMHWVGDLMMECCLKVTEAADSGAVTLELVEGSMVDQQGARVPCRFQCRINLETGEATLTVLGIPGNDWSRSPRTAKTAVQGTGEYDVRFANFDDELLLWVNGSRVQFSQPTEYTFPSQDPRLRNNRPTEADLAPVGIKIDNASVTVADLKVKRDIYYIATTDTSVSPLRDYMENTILTSSPSEATQREFMSNPGLWGAFDHLRGIEFTTGPDDFLPLGDNSPQSADGRLWHGSPFVNRRLLIGEALFIYWPHSWMFPLPNVRDMEFVR